MMKRLTLLFLLGLALKGLAQAPPQMINYQGVVRSANGDPKANQALGVKFEILQGSNSGAVVFTEVQTLTSNAIGIFATQIGKVNTSGLGTVNWQSGSYFLRVGIDTTGATSYITLGTQQLVTVPYSFYAAAAGSAPSPTLNYTGNTLTVGGNTVSLLSSNTSTSGAITALPPLTAISDINSNYTLSIDPSTVTVSNGSISVNNSGFVALPVSSTSLTGSGAITVSTLVAGSSYNINTPSVTLTGGTTISGFPVPSGLAQVMGSFPNYSVIVTPTIAYSQQTGSLTLSNIPGTTPAYSYQFYTTPTLSLSPPYLFSGPTTNSVDLTLVTPWRKGVGLGANTVTLTSNATQSVGINIPNPTSELHVNGYSKLGLTAPAIQLYKNTSVQTAAAMGGTTTISFSSVTTAPKILSISVMVESGTNGTGNWIHPEYTGATGYQFSWKVNGTNLEVINSTANSSAILSKNIQVLITYEP